MMRREVYDRLGGLPEDRFMYGEDLEYCARARQAGFKVGYIPRALVLHYLSGSRSDYARWVESYTEATLDYYRRHGTASARARVSHFVRLGSALRGLLWSSVGLLRPALRPQAKMRCEGYRRAAALAVLYHPRNEGRGLPAA